MTTVIQKYNNLNGKTKSRESIIKLIDEAAKAKNQRIVLKLNRLSAISDLLAGSKLVLS